MSNPPSRTQSQEMRYMAVMATPTTTTTTTGLAVAGACPNGCACAIDNPTATTTIHGSVAVHTSHFEHHPRALHTPPAAHSSIDTEVFCYFCCP